MDKSEQFKQKYIDAAILSSKALGDGDYKTANKQAKVINGICEKIKKGSVDKNILVELLNHEYIGVSAYAAVELLRLRYQTEKAEGALERIALMDETGKGVDEKLRIMASQRVLDMWRTKGYVT
jgi:hypothetical protein